MSFTFAQMSVAFTFGINFSDVATPSMIAFFGLASTHLPLP